MSLKSLCLALSVLVAVQGATIHTPANHARFNKRTNIVNNKSGPCLSAASDKNGAAVVVGACSSASAFSWTLPGSGSGMVHLYGNMCLDVTNGANEDGTKLQIWECTNGPNQKFAFTNGQIQWKGTNKCVDLTNGNHAAGTPVQLWTCFPGNTNQLWTGPSTSSGVSTVSSGVSAPASAPASGSPFKSKLGLAFPDNSASEFNRLKVAGAWYNWNNSPGSLTSTPGVTYMPQLWGYKNQGAFDSMAKNAELYLGMNEPNEPGQANMNPQQGIAMWKQSLKPLRDQGKKVCSPATSGNPNGLTWVKTFVDDCNGECTFDYTCVHWYDTTFEKFQSWVTEWHNAYPHAPVIITEMAPQNFNGGAQPTVDECWSFYQQAIPWAKSQDWIAGIFPYGFMNSLNINANAKLMNSDGTMTSLGQWILDQF